MAAEGFPVARIDEYAKPCEPAIHVLRSVVQIFEKCIVTSSREFKYRWERNQGFEIWKLSAPQKCNPSSGVSDTENIARKNPVRRCI